MDSSSLAATLRTEFQELRSEVSRLSAELAEMQAHAAVLESLAHEDPLTSLLNRRGFLRDLTRALAFSARYDTAAALMVCDLDGFKAINDQHGHGAGDLALKHVAELFRTNVRASDSVGRLGGDEFALIMWQLDEQKAAQKAAALESLVEASSFRHDGRVLPLGASIGLTMLSATDTAETALVRADWAMYARKSARKGDRQAMMSGVS